MTHLKLGQAAESLITNILQKDKFTILEQNYKKFFGEIDIIAQKEKLIIFVEVKARTTPKTSMFEIVSPAKQRKIIQVAKEYIANNKFIDVTYRFDVALVEYKQTSKDIAYIPNAFYEKR